LSLATATGILELQRARRALRGFCERRNRGRSVSAPRLLCTGTSHVLELLQTDSARQPGSGAHRALLRIEYHDGVWRVLWCRRAGCWEPYPYLPEAGSVVQIVDELEQAPLHVHWD
jgi:hypothetical protein